MEPAIAPLLLSGEQLSTPGQPETLSSRGSAQVLVDGLPADPELEGQRGLRGTVGDPRPQLRDLLGVQGPGAAAVSAPLAGQGDAFALALPDQGPLELGDPPITESSSVAIAVSSPVKGKSQLLLQKLHSHPSDRQRPHQGAQIVEVAGQAVH